MRTRSKMLPILAIATALVAPLSFAPSSSAAHHPATAQHAKVAKCHGHRATIVGNARANDIVGTPRRDVIVAGAGSDRVIGRGGNDLICGGAGRDMLDGNKGSDAIYGGAGRDWCVAWSHREHMRFHHQCEFHMDPAGHRHHPHKARMAGPAVRLGTAPDEPAPLTARQLRVGGSCVGGAYPCSPGIPQCSEDSQSVSYEAQRTVAPSIQTTGGYIAVYESFQVPDAVGNPVAIYASPNWTVYNLAAGNWFVPPLPETFPISYSFGYGNGTTGVAVTWFSYSADGSTWSDAQYAISTQYIQYGFGGYDNVDTNECNVG